MEALSEYFSALLFPLIFVGMWIGVSFQIANHGWNDLVYRFRLQDHFKGKYIGTVSGLIGQAKYNGSLTLRYNQKGILLKPLLVFRCFHPPLMIPWQEIEFSEEKKAFFFRYKELTLCDIPDVKLLIGKRDAETMEVIKWSQGV